MFELFQLAQDQLQLRDLLLVGLAHHDRGIDRRQRRAHVVDELDRARAIEEGVGVAHERGGGDGQLDAHRVMARLRGGIADRGAGLHRALPLDRAGAGEDRFEQRGLAALEWAHQCDAPGTRGSSAILRHDLPPLGRAHGLLGTVTLSSQGAAELARAQTEALPREVMPRIIPRRTARPRSRPGAAGQQRPA